MKTAMTVALAVSVFALACTASEAVPCVAASVVQKCAAPETAIARAVPVARQSPRWAGPGFWDRRHKAKLEEIASRPKEYDFVFLGDSITHVFPAGAKPTSPRRIRNNRVNELIRPFADGARIVWLDFNGVFLAPDGSISFSMMPDYLHPIEHGYRLWRAAIEPVMRNIQSKDTKGSAK